MIDGFQTWTIETLKKKINPTEASVGVFPDNSTSYIPKHATCDILINYQGSKYKEAGVNVGVKTRSLSFEVRVITRGYSGKSGAVEMLERVIEALWAKKPSSGELGGTRLEAVADGFLTSEAGIWQYYYLFKTDVIYQGAVSE